MPDRSQCGVKQCLYCKSEVPTDASVCRYCTRSIPGKPDLFNGLAFGLPCLLFVIILLFAVLALNGVSATVSIIIAILVMVVALAASFKKP